MHIVLHLTTPGLHFDVLFDCIPLKLVHPFLLYKIINKLKCLKFIAWISFILKWDLELSSRWPLLSSWSSFLAPSYSTWILIPLRNIKEHSPMPNQTFRINSLPWFRSLGSSMIPWHKPTQTRLSPFPSQSQLFWTRLVQWTLKPFLQ